MGKQKYAWVTMLPLAWLVVITMSASYAKIFSSDPRLGFLAHASRFSQILESGQLPPGVRSAADASRIIWNDRVDAAVAAFFAISVIVILADSAREWLSVLNGKKPAVSTEVPFQGRVAPVAGD
jgi:carbon starvation protein